MEINVRNFSVLCWWYIVNVFTLIAIPTVCSGVLADYGLQHSDGLLDELKLPQCREHCMDKVISFSFIYKISI